MARRKPIGIFLRHGVYCHKVKRGREWVRLSLRTKDRDTAIERKTDYDAKRRKGIPASALTGRATFEDLVARYATDYTNRDQSAWPVIQRRLKHVAKVFGGRPLAEITVLEIEDYKAQRKRMISPRTGRPYANASINRELAALRRLFRLGMELDLLGHAPKIRMLGESNVRRGFFSKEEFVAMRSHLESPLDAIVTFAYLTGWRVRDEILPLRWSAVDFEAKEIRIAVGETKNRAGRVFPLTAELDELLRPLHAEYLARKVRGFSDSHVFVRVVESRGKRAAPRTRGEFVQPVRSFGWKWKRAVTLAGCPDRIPHDLRRTAVRNMVRLGVPGSVCMDLVGHKTKSMLERYNITGKSDSDIAREKLTGQLPTLPPTRPGREVRRKARALARVLALAPNTGPKDLSRPV